jgi:hypothetical protein
VGTSPCAQEEIVQSARRSQFESPVPKNRQMVKMTIGDPRRIRACIGI